MPRIRLLFAAAFCSLLVACSAKPRFFNEYKIDVQQGNVLSQEVVGQLKPGQTQDQVRFLLGSPVITDIFHQQRWDYIYYYRNGQTSKVETRKFSVYFNTEKRLERVGGDVEVGSVAELTTPVSNSRLVDLGTLTGEEADTPLPPREEPSMLSKIIKNLGFGE